LSGFSAHALTLGPVQVQSVLGEPLRAEVELVDLNPAEAGSVRAEIASEAFFRMLGLGYKPLLSGVQLSLQRKPDGRSVIRLDSKEAVAEPFLDLILEVTWPSGKLARDFTLLFASPAAGKPVEPALAMADLQAAKVAVATPDAAPLIPVPGQAASEKAAATAKPTPAKAESIPTAADRRVLVKPGDTASKLLMTTPINQVSLDQMLVALLRNNPNAFVAGNVNRLMAGAVLAMPTPEQALAIDRQAATQMIVLQSEDFDAFRQQLARNVGLAQTPPPSREVSGKVQSLAEDKSPRPAPADKLTLTKGALTGSGAEEKIAQAQQAKDTTERLAELSKNLRDLDEASKLGKAAGLPATSTAAAAKPGQSLASQGESKAPVDTITAISGSAVPSVKAQAPVVAANPNPNLIDRLAQNPLVLPASGVAGLLLLLVSWGVFRWRRTAPPVPSRTEKKDSDAQTLEGGEAMTPEGYTSSSVRGLVEPTMHEDASGQDLLKQVQNELASDSTTDFESLLRAGLEKNPNEIALHLELMEIYGERQDSAAFEAQALKVLNLTGGKGEDWDKVLHMGRTVDPGNPLYLPDMESAPAKRVPPFAGLDLELKQDLPASPASVALIRAADRDDDNEDADFALDTSPRAAVHSAKPAVLGRLDLSSLSLDLNVPSASPSNQGEIPSASTAVPGKSR
jgi:pilus assembly protein FimV